MTTPTFSSDPVLDDVKSSLNVVQEFVTATLNERLSELKELANSDTVDLPTLKAKAKELADLVQAQTLARESVENLEQGKNLEQRVLTVAADDTVPLSQVQDSATKWATDAARYLDQARQDVTQAAKLVSKQPGFFSNLAKFFKKSPSDSTTPEQSFWDRVSIATFGLAVLSSRVTKLPGALMEQLEQHIDRRVVAVSEVVNHWKHRATSEYQGMKNELTEVVRSGVNKADTAAQKVVDGAQDLWDRSHAAGSAVNSVLLDSVDGAVGRIETFVGNARTKIANWSASVYEALQEQKQSLGSHYNNNIEERRRNRQATPPPLPEGLEPQAPKAP